MLGIQEMIALRKVTKERPKVQEVWCQAQIDDFNHVVIMVEDLIATAVASNNSPQQYTMLQEAKQNFISSFLDMSERYRRLETNQ